ncbi:MAG: SDR family NAD(P)-dependent oxidoreductase [Desulfobacterales bacterium]|nr:SDR family NAD(P)-dependent oxidoreductase [Desulfobacterales bacterium]
MNTTPTTDTQLSASQRVLLALKEAKFKIESYERQKSEPIAIIGMGCRFPGDADTPEKYWEFLSSGKNGIREIPKDRWNVESLYDPNPDALGKIYIRHAGFIDHPDQFDPAFFRMSPREAESLDPQHRLFLEVAWESLEHAGIDPKTLIGSQTGVFAGIGQNDYARFQLNSGNLSRITAYDGTGNLFCFVSGRLAYILGLNGPNVTLDTACSSSLVAIHLACQSLRARECNMAIAGGVHLVFSPEITVFLCRTHVLSPDGICRTFDANANGFGRGEGCGVIILKRLSDALAQNNNILALIRGSAINHDGASSGLTVPNQLAQNALIRQAICNSNIDPTQIGYIEAHGTGTSLGDPIELAALASVFNTHPLYIGSVKTNFGHLEAAAGIAGLMKVVLALQHRQIPPHLHFNQPTPHFDWNRYAFKVPTQNVEWTSNRIAGVSSFGMSGTNAHIILEASPITDSHLKVGKSTHVFHKERYWVSSEAVQPAVLHTENAKPIHVLLGKRVRLPFSQEIRFENVLSPDSPRFMNEHRIFNIVIAPAASHISMVLSAVKTAFGKEYCLIEDIVFSRALILSESEPRRVQLIFNPEQNELNVFMFKLVSCEKTDEEMSDSSWVLHVTGKIRIIPEAQTEHVKSATTLNRLQKLSQMEPVEGAHFYNNLNKAGYQLGTAFQWGKTFWCGQTESWCKIEQPLLIDTIDEYQIYPGLLDTCFQLLSSFWEHQASKLAGNTDLYVPFSLSKVKFYKRPDSQSFLWCYAKSSDKKNSGDLVLFDEEGNIYAEILGFEFRTANQQTLCQTNENECKNWLYHCVWEPKPILFSSPQYSGRVENWLIFADTKGIGKELGAKLISLGNQVLLIFQMNVPAEDPLYYQKLLEQQPWTGIVHLWHIDTNSTDSQFKLAYLSVLYIIQSMAKANSGNPPCLWVVTQGVYAAFPSTPLSCFQSPVWGLSKTVALEHPDISCICVDLPLLETENHVQNLIQEILTPDGENAILWHHNERHVARLVQYKPQLHQRTSPIIRSDHSYLITGGLGALGLHVAQWLVKQGARYIILLGRKAPSDTAKKQIEIMEQAGTTIRSILADVGNKEEISGVFQNIHDQMPELRGIIHAAGVIDDAVLLRQDANRFKNVIHPKIYGTWNLHVLSQNIPLDFFIMFSSTAALLGSPGQSNYGAANAFMDALARYRRSIGIPATSIQWNAWADSGMAAEVHKHHQVKRTEQGIRDITPDQGMLILEKLLSEPISEIAVIPIHWLVYVEKFSKKQRLLEQVIPTQVIMKNKENRFIEQLEKNSPDKQRLMILEMVRSLVASVLNIKSSHQIKVRQRLFDAGMDSLMAVELRNHLSIKLEKSLSATLVFDYPTVEALTDYLVSEMINQKSKIENRKINIQDVENNIGQDVDALLTDISQKSDEDLIQELRGLK